MGDLPEVPILGHPAERRCTISTIDLEGVECGPSSDNNGGHGLPETDPLGDSLVLIDNFALGKAQCWIGVHRGSLHEWLELITWMSRCALDTKNALNWLFSENGESKSVGNVGELLLLSPLNIEVGSFVVIVVISCLTVSKSLLEIDLLSLREPCSCWLPPSVVVLKELVVEVSVCVTDRLNLVEASWDVTYIIEILGADLTDMKIDQMAVETIDLEHLILGETFGVNPMLYVHMLVRKGDGRVSVMVAWSLLIE